MASTELRAAAQQALEALHSVEWHGGSSAWMLDDCKVDDAIKVLRAALVEDAMQKFTEVSQEIEAALAEPVQQGCDHCNQPLYAAIKCRVCGRVTEPVQEPVAWIHTDPDKRRVKFLEWRENEPGYRGDWIKTPLYTAPPQPEERNFCSRCGKRNTGIHTCTPPAPLTDEVIAELWHKNGGFHHHFARAIERWLRGHA